LASGEFTDGGQLSKVVDMLNDIRSNIVDSQNQDIQDEEASVEAFNAEITEKKNENRDFESTIVIKSAELEATNRKISENENYLSGRRVDLKGFQDDLAHENDSFAHDTEVFNQLKAELQREIDTANNALAVVENGDFAGYIGERIN
jgi:chromosome segregation ATPase